MAESDDVMKLRKAFNEIEPSRPRLLSPNPKGTWLVQIEGKPYGPYDSEQIKAMLGTASIGQDARACHSIATGGAWRVISQIDIFTQPNEKLKPQTSAVKATPISPPPRPQAGSQAAYIASSGRNVVYTAKDRDSTLKTILACIWAVWFAYIAWFFWRGLGKALLYGTVTDDQIATQFFSSAVAGSMASGPFIVLSLLAYVFLKKS